MVRLSIRLGDVHGLGMAPEPFESIVFAGFFRKDVDYVVAEIKQYPLGAIITFDTECIHTLLFQFDNYFIADGLDLAGICSCTDDEIIGK